MTTKLNSLALIIAGLFALDCAAKEPAHMEYEPIRAKFWTTEAEANDPPELLLWPGGVPDVLDIQQKIESRTPDHRYRWVTSIREPSISIYRATGEQASKTAVVICPGGGYFGLAIDHEGHDVARWLNSLGITAVVLKNRVKDYGHPAPKDDAQRAIATVRSKTDELGIDSTRIGVMGFSAGGHLASTAGTRYRDIDIGGQEISSRPDFMILAYPVISMDKAITHAGSRANLLGDNPSEELIAEYSNETQVTADTPPTFLVHSLSDRAVLLEHSLRMYRALQKAGVPAELAMYEQGVHGFGLVSEQIPAAEWPLRCEKWLRKQGFLGNN